MVRLSPFFFLYSPSCMYTMIKYKSQFSDKSPLLLCQPANLTGDSITDSSILNNLNGSVPVCILNRDLQVYKGNVT